MDLHRVTAKSQAAKVWIEAAENIRNFPIRTPSRRCYSWGSRPDISKTLNRAVARNLRAKFLLGLNPYVDVERAVRVTNSSEHQALVLKPRRSITLLKNQNNLLPLNMRAKSIAVIGPNAAKVHLGGYSDNPQRGVSVLAGNQGQGGRQGQSRVRGRMITKEGGDWFADTANLSDPAEDRKLIAEAVQVAKTRTSRCSCWRQRGYEQGGLGR